jgi:predicted nucleic acid-binding protein
MVVLDTSTLILLAKTDLLPRLIERTHVAIPQEVQREALAKEELYDAKVIAQALASGAMRRLATTPLKRRQQLEADFALGPGEAAAVLWAKIRGAPVGTDDGPAIKAAKILGVPFFTAIHVLTALYEKGRLDRAMALAQLEQLQQVGRYSVSIVEDARTSIRKK